MSRRTLWVIVLLALGLGVAYLFWDNATSKQVAKQSRQELKAHLGEESDFYGEGLENRQYDKDGKLEQSFSAAKSTHYASSASTEFEQPRIQAQDSDGRIWQIRAKEGSMKDKTREIFLQHQVEIAPLNLPENEQVKVETSELFIHLQNKSAQTDKAVRISNPDSVTTGLGMTFSVPEQTLELHQQVRTQYVPPAK